MDPNANLQEQEQILTGRPDASRLDELRRALSGWLLRGGFEPKWSACPLASRFYGK